MIPPLTADDRFVNNLLRMQKIGNAKGWQDFLTELTEAMGPDNPDEPCFFCLLSQHGPNRNSVLGVDVTVTTGWIVRTMRQLRVMGILSQVACEWAPQEFRRWSYTYVHTYSCRKH